MEIRIREINNSDNMDGFHFFQSFDFDPEFKHVLLTLNDQGQEVVWCYAWNLESIAEANTTDYIEIYLYEALEGGKGYGTKMIEMLKKRYAHIGVFGSQNDKFWHKVGFRWTRTISKVEGMSRIMTWRR